jgi:hypothetical protein
MLLAYDQLHELLGFDIDLVGFDCARELGGEFGERPRFWRCPFDPGCGSSHPKECPLMKRLAQIARAPRRRQ